MTSEARPERRRLRDRSGGQRVTNTELFVDLVYVFAVTQLSQHLLSDPTVRGALQSALSLAMVWLIWVNTAWVTNWLDPERIENRLMLVAGMLVSLAMSVALPAAFDGLGLVIGIGYAVQQIGRNLFMVLVLRGALQRNFERILVWCLVVGALAVAGGLAHGPPRVVLWVLAVAVDTTGSVAGCPTPGLGRTRTQEWTLEGGHFAERCQAFILIALGESIIITGRTLSGMRGFAGPEIAALVEAFAESVALWWLYFDRAASATAGIIASSRNPGRLGRSVYHLTHPVMVAGVIAMSAGDGKILASPLSRVSAPAAWMVLGGPALFLAGHAAFVFGVWRLFPRMRAIGVVVLVLLGLARVALPGIALAACATVVIAVVAALDYRQRPRAVTTPPYPSRR